MIGPIIASTSSSPRTISLPSSSSSSSISSSSSSSLSPPSPPPSNSIGLLTISHLLSRGSTFSPSTLLTLNLSHLHLIHLDPYALSTLSHCRSLTVSHNHIGSNSLSSFSAIPQLTHLDISNNSEMRDIHWMPLMPNLLSLNMAHCNFNAQQITSGVVSVSVPASSSSYSPSSPSSSWLNHLSNCLPLLQSIDWRGNKLLQAQDEIYGESTANSENNYKNGGKAKSNVPIPKKNQSTKNDNVEDDDDDNDNDNSAPQRRPSLLSNSSLSLSPSSPSLPPSHYPFYSLLPIHHFPSLLLVNSVPIGISPSHILPILRIYHDGVESLKTWGREGREWKREMGGNLREFGKEMEEEKGKIEGQITGVKKDLEIHMGELLVKMNEIKEEEGKLNKDVEKGKEQLSLMRERMEKMNLELE